RELIERFDCQRVPAILFHSHQFNDIYTGVAPEEIFGLLEPAADLRLPQVVHVASCDAYTPESRHVFADERSVVAHAFEDAVYTDANEIIWLVAEIDSKLQASRELTESWCARLEALARQSEFAKTRIWLISPEGFTAEAMEVLEGRGGYGSSRQQVELLTRWISGTEGKQKHAGEADEFVMILPMGEDNELVAASIVEQIARRSNFRPEAINQIKTAIVEAYINASEHSFSPDGKIYQRFRVESDKLVITISSRGVVPFTMASPEANQAQAEAAGSVTQERRGWGLKLIRTLMDEVEFEKADEGTSLRMTKYLRD
ncbi:MAG: ATP-binding protein, partial [Acidobacteriota bacterium]